MSLSGYEISLPDGSSVSVNDTGRIGDYGKRVYRWSVRTVHGAKPVHGEDIQSHTDAKDAMCALLGFLDACGEAYALKMRHPDFTPENLDLFPPKIAEWAYQLNDEIGMARLELEEDHQ